MIVNLQINEHEAEEQKADQHDRRLLCAGNLHGRRPSLATDRTKAISSSTTPRIGWFNTSAATPAAPKHMATTPYRVMTA